MIPEHLIAPAKRVLTDMIAGDMPLTAQRIYRFTASFDDTRAVYQWLIADDFITADEWKITAAGRTWLSDLAVAS